MSTLEGASRGPGDMTDSLSYKPSSCEEGINGDNMDMLRMYRDMKVSKKAKIRNQYNQVPHLTQDTTWESDKNTRKHHIQECQEVSPFPAGDHKAAMNGQESMANTKHK